RWFSRPSESKPNIRRSSTNSSIETSTYWRRSVSMLISEHWPTEELSQESTTDEYAPNTSGRATWCSGRSRSATRPGPAASWPQTGRVPTELSMLSETGLIRWQRWKDGCCQEPSTSQTCENFTHDNVSKMTWLVLPLVPS
ncbi:hypothetical protein GW17_00055895, partial [Ensete ventricosum]